MPGKLQELVLQVVVKVLGGAIEPTPAWLMRPGCIECGKRWPLICSIYRHLTYQALPEEMPTNEGRRVDCVLRVANHAPRIIEVDERQHFNHYRAATLRLYPPDIRLAFDRKMWIEHSEAKATLEAGGWGTPKPPLFPGDGGRHRQRAFRDALCDILPPDYGFLPTLRLADFEVDGWLIANDVCKRMKDLLDCKFSN